MGHWIKKIPDTIRRLRHNADHLHRTPLHSNQRLDHSSNGRNTHTGPRSRTLEDLKPIRHDSLHRIESSVRNNHAQHGARHCQDGSLRIRMKQKLMPCQQFHLEGHVINFTQTCSPSISFTPKREGGNVILHTEFFSLRLSNTTIRNGQSYSHSSDPIWVRNS